MSKRSTPSSAERGVTLPELLVALTVALLVTAAAFGLALASRSLYDADRVRVRLNQDLRAAMDFLGTDVRQAGERLGDDFPAVVIEDGGAGPDVLVLRRNLLSTVLRLCRPLQDAQREIYVGEPDIAPPPGCSRVSDDDGDSWPENLQAWREHRFVSGGRARGFVFDPSEGEGEFFDFVSEDPDRLLLLADEGTRWHRRYDVTSQSRLYILEERRYELAGDLLRLVKDGEADEPLHLVEGITALSVEALLRDGSRLESFGPADVWTELAALEIELRGETVEDDRTIERRWSTRFVPRNVLSRGR